MAEQDDLRARIEQATEDMDHILEQIQGDHINEESAKLFNETLKELSSIKTKLKALVRTSDTPKQVERMQSDVENNIENLRKQYREAEKRANDAIRKERCKKSTEAVYAHYNNTVDIITDILKKPNYEHFQTGNLPRTRPGTKMV